MENRYSQEQIQRQKALYRAHAPHLKPPTGRSNHVRPQSFHHAFGSGTYIVSRRGSGSVSFKVMTSLPAAIKALKLRGHSRLYAVHYREKQS